ncbi:unnamed protein product, partial [Candidula unifasciata]
MMIALAMFVSCLVGAAVGGNNWALLVAGSNTYDNYRHQADICHAYHIVSSHGIPDERIVVMMYDDIANNPDNPFPGNIINRPGGPNVYPGVPKDYTGAVSCCANNNSAINNKTYFIHSGPEDRVFVNFADHGAPGILAFPIRHAALEIQMCLLPPVYATTAANSDESSYACYYDNTRKTCLGDVYS